MKRAMLALCLLVGMGLAAAQAQGGEGNWLSFSLSREGPPLTRYTVRIEQATGHGFYRSDVQTAVPLPGTSGAETPISVDPQLAKKIFAAVPLVKSNRCDAHDKNLAQTGVKVLRYSADATVFECTYNYGLDDRVNTATTVLLALGETMQYGERLASDLRFSRLGLDSDLDALQSALADGRALEPANIAPVLQAILQDDRVMDRVHRKATRILERSGFAGTQALPGISAR
jgi:hypothetical protein